MTGTTNTPPPVLLLHGFTGSHHDFDAIIEPLRRDRPVLTPDLPGHGIQPTPADGDYSLPAHVRWVTALLEDEGVGDFHLIGHSHGGLIAQWLAFAMPARVASMVLIGTGPGAPADHTTERIRTLARVLLEHGKEAAWAVMAGPASSDSAVDSAPPTPSSARQAFVRQRFMAMPTEAVIGVARNLLTAAPLGAFLYGIDFPVLVCHGQGDDSWTPEQQQQLARCIPKADYRVVPNALHTPSVENPDGLLSLLVPFLTAHDPALHT